MKISIILSLALASSLLVASDEDLLLKKLYEKAFLKGKKTSSKSDTLFLPLVVNGVEHTEVFSYMDSDKVYIKEKDAKYILSLFKKEYRGDFAYQKDEKGYIDISFLNKEGVEVKYDDKLIVLKLTIPPKLKAPTDIDLGYKRVIKKDGAIKPKIFSGGMNLYFNQYYNNSNPQRSFKRQKLNASSELFLNLKEFVLEGRVRYKEDAKDEFIRDRFRLVRDIESKDLRVILGDTYMPKHNRQDLVDSFGLSVEKVFNISDAFGQNTKRMNSYEFFLKDDSSVEIYIDDRFVRRLHLKAGTHNIHDLNLPAGLVNVKLKIIEDSGKVETLTFDDFQYPDLLRKGLMKYGVGYGITSYKDSDGKIKYNRDDKFLSLYFDYGLTNSITLRSGLQSLDDYRSYALDIFYGTKFGLFDFYQVNSKNDFFSLNGKKRGVEYRTNIGKVNISLFNELIDKDYTTVATYNKTRDRKKIENKRLHIYAPLNNRYSLSFSTSLYTQDSEDRRKYSASLTKSFLHSSYVRLSYEYDKDVATDVKKEKLYLTFNYRFGKEREYELQYDKHFKDDDSQSVSLNYITDGYYNTFYSLDIDDMKNSDRYSFRNYIRNEKFRLNTSYDYTKNSNSKDTQTLSLQLETGVVFAGSSFTITEPMSSSFVIVENDDKIEKPLGVVGFQKEDEFKYKTYALPLSNHRVKTLEADESDLEMGVDLYEPIQKFVTGYRSGSVMKLDVKSLYSVKGILVDEFGKPIKLRAFKLYNIDRNQKEMAFTNDKGEFEIQNIESGRYNAVLFRKADEIDNTKFSFVIDENSLKRNVIDVGTIKVKLSDKKKSKRYMIYRR